VTAISTATGLVTTEYANRTAAAEATDFRVQRAQLGPRFFRIGEIDVCVRSEVPDVLPELALLYGDWEQNHLVDGLTVSVQRRRSRYTGGRRFIIDGGGDQLFSVKRMEEILPHVEWAVNWEVVKRVERFLQVHAAVMQRGSAACVMPGSPGSGKTTLAAGLLSRGWRLLSDEFALVSPQSGRVHPYPKALCIKQGSMQVVRSLGLPLMASRCYKKGRKGRVAYVSPAVMQCDCVGEACPIGCVLFPTYRVGARPKTEPMSRGEAVFELNRLAFNGQRFGAQAMAILDRTLTGVRCYRLVSGEIRSTCDLVEQVSDAHFA